MSAVRRNGKDENSSGEVRYQNTHARCNLVFSVLSFETTEGAATLSLDLIIFNERASLPRTGNRFRS